MTEETTGRRLRPVEKYSLPMTEDVTVPNPAGGRMTVVASKVVIAIGKDGPVYSVIARDSAGNKHAFPIDPGLAESLLEKVDRR